MVTIYVSIYNGDLFLYWKIMVLNIDIVWGIFIKTLRIIILKIN